MATSNSYWNRSGGLPPRPQQRKPLAKRLQYGLAGSFLQHTDPELEAKKAAAEAKTQRLSANVQKILQTNPDGGALRLAGTKSTKHNVTLSGSPTKIERIRAAFERDSGLLSAEENALVHFIDNKSDLVEDLADDERTLILKALGGSDQYVNTLLTVPDGLTYEHHRRSLDCYLIELVTKNIPNSEKEKFFFNLPPQERHAFEKLLYTPDGGDSLYSNYGRGKARKVKPQGRGRDTDGNNGISIVTTKKGYIRREETLPTKFQPVGIGNFRTHKQEVEHAAFVEALSSHYFKPVPVDQAPDNRGWHRCILCGFESFWPGDQERHLYDTHGSRTSENHERFFGDCVAKFKKFWKVKRSGDQAEADRLFSKLPGPKERKPRGGNRKTPKINKIAESGGKQEETNEAAVSSSSKPSDQDGRGSTKTISSSDKDKGRGQ